MIRLTITYPKKPQNYSKLSKQSFQIILGAGGNWPEVHNWKAFIKTNKQTKKNWTSVRKVGIWGPCVCFHSLPAIPQPTTNSWEGEQIRIWSCYKYYLKQRLQTTSNGPIRAHCLPFFFFHKVLLVESILINLHVIDAGFHTITAELSSYNRNCTAKFKMFTIWSCIESFLAPDLQCSAFNSELWDGQINREVGAIHRKRCS